MTLKISIFIAAFVFIIGFFVALKTQYFKRFNMRYSIKAMFPFESNYKCKFSDNATSNFLLIASGVLLSLFSLIFDMKHTNGFLVYCSVSGVLISIICVALFFIGFKSNKVHLVLSVMLFAFVATLTFSLELGIYKLLESNSTLLIKICLAIPAINIVIQIILMFHPSLTKTFKAEEVKNEDGSVSYIRPKKIQIAFTEWMFMICFLINILTMFIVSFAL